MGTRLFADPLGLKRFLARVRLISAKADAARPIGIRIPTNPLELPARPLPRPVALLGCRYPRGFPRPARVASAPAACREAVPGAVRCAGVLPALAWPPGLS